MSSIFSADFCLQSTEYTERLLFDSRLQLHFELHGLNLVHVHMPHATLQHATVSRIVPDELLRPSGGQRVLSAWHHLSSAFPGRDSVLFLPKLHHCSRTNSADLHRPLLLLNYIHMSSNDTSSFLIIGFYKMRNFQVFFLFFRQVSPKLDTAT